MRDDHTLDYIGRPERAAPAEGYANTHEKEQTRIVAAAFAPITAGKRRTEKQRRR